MFGNSSFRIMRSVPPVTKNLIIINLLIWLAMAVVPSLGAALVRRCGLHLFTASDFNPVQLLTYMFLHDPKNILHIFFNMFTLYMFGRSLEHIWGSRRFLLFYMVCGVGAALAQETVWLCTWQHEYFASIAALNGADYESAREFVLNAISSGDTTWQANMNLMRDSMVTIGASGAIFGVLLGFAFVFPDLPLYIMFIPVPIKAKYMVIGYAVLEFFLGVSTSDSTVAHFAHLGGMLFGLVILLYWKKKGLLRGGRYY